MSADPAASRRALLRQLLEHDEGSRVATICAIRSTGSTAKFSMGLSEC